MEGTEVILEEVGDDYSQAFGEEAAGTAGAQDDVRQQPENVSGEDSTATDDEAEPQGGLPPEGDEEVEPDGGTEKALRDTKAWATGLSQENADLKRRLAELEQKIETEPPAVESDPLDAFDLTDDERGLLEEYPDMAGIIGKMASAIRQASESTSFERNPALSRLMGQVEQLGYNNAILGGTFDKDGNYVEGHSDGLRIAAAKEFREYWSGKGVDIDTVYDPVQAIRMIGDYKESQLKKATASHDANFKAAAAKIKNRAAGGVTSGNGVDLGSEDKDDYHSAFVEEATKGL